MPGPGDRGGVKAKPRDAKGALRRMGGYLLRYRYAVLALLLCAVLSNLGNLLGPRFAGKAIGEAEAGFRQGVGKVDMDAVLRYALYMLAAYAGSNILSFLVHIGMARVAKRVARNLRRDVFDKLMTLPVGYFDRNQAGDIISRVSYDVDVISTSLSTDVIQILTSTITVAGSFTMMCIISPPLVLCMLFTIPVSILFTRHMSKKTRPLYAKRSKSYGEMNGFAEEMFTGQKTILAYAQEGEMSRRFGRINKNAAEAYRDAAGMGMTMGPTIGMISNFGLAAIGLGGAVLYLYRIVGLAQISSFVLYSRKFSGPITEISNIINEIFSALAAAERVFQLLDQPEEAKDLYGAKELAGCKGHVEIRDVSFGYTPEKTVLHHLDLEAKPGQTVAIVGPTGAGKTTGQGTQQLDGAARAEIRAADADDDQRLGAAADQLGRAHDGVQLGVLDALGQLRPAGEIGARAGLVRKGLMGLRGQGKIGAAAAEEAFRAGVIDLDHRNLLIMIV